MKKTLLVLGMIALFTPLSAYAAIATDAASYANPATVMYGGFASGRNLVLYQPADTSAPSCVQTAGTATSSLNTLCSSVFNGQVSGSYKIVQPTVTGCDALSYSACASANVGMPGANEADFSIVGDPPVNPSTYGYNAFKNIFIAATTSSTTILAIVDIPTLDMFMGLLLFLMSMFGVLYLLKVQS